MVIRSKRLKWVAEMKSFGVEKCTERIPFLTVTFNPILYVLITNCRPGISKNAQMRFLKEQDTLQFYNLHNKIN
jgi:hypothetical protein